jgi:hypothetical protein
MVIEYGGCHGRRDTSSTPDTTIKGTLPGFLLSSMSGKHIHPGFHKVFARSEPNS